MSEYPKAPVGQFGQHQVAYCKTPSGRGIICEIVMGQGLIALGASAAAVGHEYDDNEAASRAFVKALTKCHEWEAVMEQKKAYELANVEPVEPDFDALEDNEDFEDDDEEGDEPEDSVDEDEEDEE